MTLTEIFKEVDQITEENVKKIQEDSAHFKRNLEEWMNSSNPYFTERIDDIIVFVEKYLQWRRELSYEFYTMFYDVMWKENYNIFDPLLHFISCYCIDDGEFKVVWYKQEVVTKPSDIGDEFIDFPTGEVIEVESTSDVIEAWPVLTTNCNDGTQNIRVIIDAMNKYEENLRIREEERKKEEQRWLQMHNRHSPNCHTESPT